eukprot:164874_1
MKLFVVFALLALVTPTSGAYYKATKSKDAQRASYRQKMKPMTFWDRIVTFMDMYSEYLSALHSVQPYLDSKNTVDKEEYLMGPFRDLSVASIKEEKFKFTALLWGDFILSPEDGSVQTRERLDEAIFNLLQLRVCVISHYIRLRNITTRSKTEQNDYQAFRDMYNDMTDSVQSVMAHARSSKMGKLSRKSLRALGHSLAPDEDENEPGPSRCAKNKLKKMKKRKKSKNMKKRKNMKYSGSDTGYRDTYNKKTKSTYAQSTNNQSDTVSAEVKYGTRYAGDFANETHKKKKPKHKKSCAWPRCDVTNEDQKLKKCTRCRNVRYCSPKHQKADWKYNHRNVCSCYIGD